MTEDDNCSMNRWFEKRRIHLHQRLQEEIDIRLKGDVSLIRQSTPFIRVMLHSAISSGSQYDTSERAMLTIWSPSENQLSELNEGSVVEIQGITVRPIPFDGLLQLSANGRAIVRKYEEVTPATMFFRARCTLSMFKVHALSHSGSFRNGKGLAHFDVMGIMVDNVKPSDGTIPGYELYVTDESCLCLRVHFDKLPYDLAKNWQGQDTCMGNLGRSSGRHVAFRDLQLLPFDTIKNCAVAKYTTVSCHSRTHTSRQSRVEEWIKGSGEKLRRILGHIEASLPSFQLETGFSEIGYIVGVNTADGKTLQIQVDCGTSVHEWIVSTNILEAIRHGLKDAPAPPVAFLESYELRLVDMRRLDFLFRARDVLWRFDVVTSAHDRTYPVVQKISRIDQRHVAALYLK